MMRTIEAIIVIIIMFAAFFMASYFIVLPSPREVSPLNLKALALTVLKNLDVNGYLGEVVFSEDSGTWTELQTVLSASLPPHIAYNLTVYEITEDGVYVPKKSVSNVYGGRVSFTESVSYMVSSPDVTYKTVAQKISEGGKNLTLYILNCADANGWWITGYTAQMLAQDVYNMLKPYFETTILVNHTSQLRDLLDGKNLTTNSKERVEDAVIINTFGEVVPIPQEYTEGGSRQGQGYDSSRRSYALYCYTLGKKVREHNWKWISIVGYPFFYVTNTIKFYNIQNGYGIYGIVNVGEVEANGRREEGQAGLNAFLQGLNNENYAYNSAWITKDITTEYGVRVQFTAEAYYRSNYYGIYPASEQSASRALPGPGAPNDITRRYNLAIIAPVFNPVNGYYAAATFRHNSGKGALIAIGLTRTPDIRITALALLIYYKPNIFKETFTAPGKSRLVILQLAQLGSV
jgi:hypothetical protein